MDDCGQEAKKFPPFYGHPEFYRIVERLKQLHSDKNRDYTFGGPPLGNFERVSAIMKLYPGFDWATEQGTMMVYAFKQLDAYMWLCAKGHSTVTGEGKVPRLRDIAVYMIINMCKEFDLQQQEENRVYDEMRRAATSPFERDAVRKTGPRVESLSSAQGEHLIERDLAAAGCTEGGVNTLRPPSSRRRPIARSRRSSRRDQRRRRR